MELSNLVKVVVSTLDSNESHVATVKVDNGEVLVDELYQKLSREIGLKDSCQPYFSLFRGCKRPTKRYKAGERLPSKANDLSIQRWCFDPKVECNKLLNDAVATHLLYLQAAEGINSGRLKPSTEDRQKLDEFLDPSFVLENQYVATCRTIPRYWSHRFTDCLITEDFVTDSVQLPQKTTLTIYIGRTGLELETADNAYTCEWKNLKSWSRDKDNTSRVYFELLAEHKLQTLCMETDQWELVLATVVEIIRVLQSEDKEAPLFLTSMIRAQDDVMTHWNNVLYKPSDD